MKLYFLDPTGRSAINVRRLRKIGYDTSRIIAQDVKQSVQTLIVLGNGSPEDKVLGILSFHLNGVNIVGMVKPTQSHLGALDQLKTYVELKFEKIMFIIDQDDLTLNFLFDEAVKRLQAIGISTRQQETSEELDRVRAYQCSFSNKTFDIVIVASGLEESRTRKHTIEDHLLCAAGIDNVENSKDSWTCLNSDDQEDVLELFKDRDLVEVLFPQHIYGCKFLETAHP
jgi:hypothetical protein